MRLNFFRRFRLLPGLWLNVSKRSVSAGIGMRGLKTTFGKRGQTTTIGLPGTGLSVSHLNRRSAKTADSGEAALLAKALRSKRRPPS